jgi:predicted  nucleic acid-binding Zn-ribbon protein
MEILRRFGNYIASKISQDYVKINTEIAEKEETISALERELDSAETAKEELKKSLEDQRRTYENEIGDISRKNESLKSLAQKVAQDAEDTNKRMMLAIVSSKQGVSPFLLEEFRNFPVRKELVKTVQHLQDETTRSKKDLASTQEEIEMLQQRIEDYYANLLVTALHITRETQSLMDKVPFAVYTPSGEEIYASRTFEEFTRRYSQPFAVQNEIANEEFRKQISQEEKIVPYGELRARFLSFSYQGKQTAIAVSLSLSTQEKIRNRVLKRAEKKAVSSFRNLWETCIKYISTR